MRGPASDLEGLFKSQSTRNHWRGDGTISLTSWLVTVFLPTVLTRVVSAHADDISNYIGGLNHGPGASRYQPKDIPSAAVQTTMAAQLIAHVAHDSARRMLETTWRTISTRPDFAGHEYPDFDGFAILLIELEQTQGYDRQASFFALTEYLDVVTFMKRANCWYTTGPSAFASFEANLNDHRSRLHTRFNVQLPDQFWTSIVHTWLSEREHDPTTYGQAWLLVGSALRSFVASAASTAAGSTATTSHDRIQRACDSACIQHAAEGIARAQYAVPPSSSSSSSTETKSEPSAAGSPSKIAIEATAAGAPTQPQADFTADLKRWLALSPDAQARTKKPSAPAVTGSSTGWRRYCHRDFESVDDIYRRMHDSVAITKITYATYCAQIHTVIGGMDSATLTGTGAAPVAALPGVESAIGECLDGTMPRFGQGAECSYCKTKGLRYLYHTLEDCVQCTDDMGPSKHHTHGSTHAQRKTALDQRMAERNKRRDDDPNGRRRRGGKASSKSTKSDTTPVSSVTTASSIADAVKQGMSDFVKANAKAGTTPVAPPDATSNGDAPGAALTFAGDTTFTFAPVVFDHGTDDAASPGYVDYGFPDTDDLPRITGDVRRTDLDAGSAAASINEELGHLGVDPVDLHIPARPTHGDAVGEEQNLQDLMTRNQSRGADTAIVSDNIIDAASVTGADVFTDHNGIDATRPRRVAGAFNLDCTAIRRNIGIIASVLILVLASIAMPAASAAEVAGSTVATSFFDTVRGFGRDHLRVHDGESWVPSPDHASLDIDLIDSMICPVAGTRAAAAAPLSWVDSDNHTRANVLCDSGAGLSCFTDRRYFDSIVPIPSRRCQVANGTRLIINQGGIASVPCFTDQGNIVVIRLFAAYTPTFFAPIVSEVQLRDRPGSVIVKHAGDSAAHVQDGYGNTRTLPLRTVAGANWLEALSPADPQFRSVCQRYRDDTANGLTSLPVTGSADVVQRTLAAIAQHSSKYGSKGHGDTAISPLGPENIEHGNGHGAEQFSTNNTDSPTALRQMQDELLRGRHDRPDDRTDRYLSSTDNHSRNHFSDDNNRHLCNHTTGIQQRRGARPPCQCCESAKAVRNAKLHSRPKPQCTVPGEQIAVDHFGPVKPKGLGNFLYGLRFQDRATKLLFTVPTRTVTADETVAAFDKALAFFSTAGHRPQAFYPDGHGSFVNDAISKWAARHRVGMHPGAPYQHDSNWVERAHRDLNSDMRVVLEASRMPQCCWPLLLQGLDHFRNRECIRDSTGITAYEAWHGQKPDIFWNHPLGSTVTIITHPESRHKHNATFGAVARTGYLVGFRRGGFVCLDPVSCRLVHVGYGEARVDPMYEPRTSTPRDLWKLIIMDPTRSDLRSIMQITGQTPATVTNDPRLRPTAAEAAAAERSILRGYDNAKSRGIDLTDENLRRRIVAHRLNKARITADDNGIGTPAATTARGNAAAGGHATHPVTTTSSTATPATMAPPPIHQWVHTVDDHGAVNNLPEGWTVIRQGTRGPKYGNKPIWGYLPPGAARSTKNIIRSYTQLGRHINATPAAEADAPSTPAPRADGGDVPPTASSGASDHAETASSLPTAAPPTTTTSPASETDEPSTMPPTASDGDAWPERLADQAAVDQDWDTITTSKGQTMNDIATAHNESIARLLGNNPQFRRHDGDTIDGDTKLPARRRVWLRPQGSEADTGDLPISSFPRSSFQFLPKDSFESPSAVTMANHLRRDEATFVAWARNASPEQFLAAINTRTIEDPDHPSPRWAFSHDNPDYAGWCASAEKEVRTLMKMHAFSVVRLKDLPGSAKLFRSLFALRIKRGPDGEIKSLKSRLSLDGSQHEETRSTFSPTAYPTTSRIVNANACRLHNLTHSADITAAYIHAKAPDANTFIRFPSNVDARDSAGHVLVAHCHRALYGHPLAGKLWWEDLNGWACHDDDGPGFTESDGDVTLWTKYDDHGNYVHIYVYVDDICVTGNNDQLVMDWWIKPMKARYDARYEGPMSYMLGTKVEQSNAPVPNAKTTATADISIDDLKPRRSPVPWTTTFSNRQKVLDLLTLTGLTDANPADTPMETGVDKILASGPPRDTLTAEEDRELRALDDRLHYSHVVSALAFVARSSRPDLLHATNLLARFMANPQKPHYAALRRLLRYCNGTLDLGIRYSADGDPTIRYYTDSSHQDCADSRHSTTGYCATFMGAAISYHSRKTHRSAVSTCESELYALDAGINDHLAIRKDIAALRIPVTDVPTFFVDNRSTCHVANNRGAYGRMRHIDAMYLRVQEHIREGSVRVERIASGANPADMFTKALPVKDFLRHRRMVMGM